MERESSCRGELLEFESPLRFPVVRGRGTEGGLVVQRRAAKERHSVGPNGGAGLKMTREGVRVGVRCT